MLLGKRKEVNRSGSASKDREFASADYLTLPLVIGDDHIDISAVADVLAEVVRSVPVDVVRSGGAAFSQRAGS